MKQRKWIDLILFYSTLLLIFSGIVLYIMPHGRVAYFTGWTFLGLDKDNWDNLHVIFGLLMSIFVIWHLILNWKPLQNYLFQKESLFALIFIGFISIGTILQIQPFKAVADFEEKIKNSWEVNKIPVPIPHAEKFTLKELCAKLNINLENAKNKLKKAGIKFNENQTLLEIAKQNNSTPAKIYEIISKTPTFNNSNMGYGYGRMTLKELCNTLKIDKNQCQQKLQKLGIKANLNEKVKNVAVKYQMLPIDLVEKLKEAK
ncbi:DUF4405 domain-containing protein [Caminibacter mediatlanticus]|uniref:Flavinylation-associated cytochrome domain-containing protein n=1 Tax=Caminibacter mediatlanticus TB-2 TaxID=391592 RepID=A0AAI9F2A4_9BACT|nr:DUF4405 domain-containing protein [Caminibacter mediatlanticus]EDM23599.1 hypothetical protein CMTB2_04922 [Caminibacter mediatlanticus TB-2]